MRRLINDFSLVCCNNVDVSDVGYTFYNETLGYKSYIDHMFISAVFKEKYYENSGKVLMHLAQFNLCCIKCFSGCSNQEHTSIIDEWCDNVKNELNRRVE